VALLLVADVLLDPLQVLRPKTDDAVAVLPFEGLAAKLLVGLVGRGTFQLADQLADDNRRRDRHDEMDVRFDAANFVDVGAGGVDEPAAEVVVREGFDVRREQRIALLGVPDHV